MLLISDLDGTAIDSEELILASYEHVINIHRLPCRTRDELKKYTGIALRELYTSWTTVSQCEELCETHRIFQVKNKHLIKAIPGIPEAFLALKNRGVRIVINTNRSANISEFLELTGLHAHVDQVISYNDVKNPKPDPEGVQKAMLHHNATTNQTWMLGDTHIDVLAGKNAGVRTIGAAFISNNVDFSGNPPDYIAYHPRDLLEILKS